MHGLSRCGFVSCQTRDPRDYDSPGEKRGLAIDSRACQVNDHSVTSLDTTVPAPGRVLALDVGSKRIGIAVSDPLGITAQGLPTLQRQNKRRDFEALGRLLENYQVREVVVGLPLRLSGAEGTQSEKMRRFAEDIQAHFGITVHLWDERWTSTQANRLLREAELSIQKRGQAVDQMAAVLILQSWMEAHSNENRERNRDRPEPRD